MMSIRDIAENGGMIRLEYSRGGSNKFYEIAYTFQIDKGWSEWTVRYGRIGTRGSFQTVSQKEANDRLYEKLAKGYAIVRVDKLAPPVDARAAEALAALAAVRAERATKKKAIESPAPITTERFAAIFDNEED